MPKTQPKAPHDPTKLLRPQAQRTAPRDIPFQSLKHTPAYVIDVPGLEANLERLQWFKQASGAKILLAQKAFSAFPFYELIAQYLDGTCSSGLYEAKLAHEYMPEREIEVFCPGYKTEEFPELFSIADTLIFNTFTQLERYRKWLKTEGSKVKRSPEKAIATPRLGLRINPEISSVETEIYNPAGPYSRLGMTIENFAEGAKTYGLNDISGLHFHVLCEENADALAKAWDRVKAKFSPYLEHMTWINMGGGHHLTRKDYDLKLAQEIVQDAKQRFELEVYLEPGEAIALDAGFLITEVIDTQFNGMPLAILDTSVVCHMPDVLEMPYRPRAFLLQEPKDGKEPYDLAQEQGEHLTRLGGPTCLAGDVIGDYCFGKELEVGDRIVFCDMAIYTMVKTNTFNGMPLPWIVAWTGQDLELVRSFSYEDFKQRLG